MKKRIARRKASRKKEVNLMEINLKDPKSINTRLAVYAMTALIVMVVAALPVSIGLYVLSKHTGSVEEINSILRTTAIIESIIFIITGFAGATVGKMIRISIIKEITSVIEVLTVFSNGRLIEDNHKFTSEFTLVNNTVKEARGNIKMIIDLVNSDVGTATNDLIKTNELMKKDGSEIIKLMYETVDSLTTLEEQMKNISVASLEIAEGSYQTSESIGSIADGSSKLLEKAEDLDSQMNSSRDIMGELGQSSEIVGVNMTDLIKSVGEVKEMVTSISNISSQTNLLALNASIEAARAGEHGLGFAVVAQEVGKLSTETDQITKKISELVNQLGDNGKTTSESIHATSVEMSKMTESFGEVIKGISDISKITTTLNDECQSIAAITEEQSASSEEISSTVSLISETSSKLNSEASDLSSGLENLVSEIEHTSEETKVKLVNIKNCLTYFKSK